MKTHFHSLVIKLRFFSGAMVPFFAGKSDTSSTTWNDNLCAIFNSYALLSLFSARTPSSLVESPIRKFSTVSSHNSSNSRKHVISCEAAISNHLQKVTKVTDSFSDFAFLSAAKSGKSRIKNLFLDSLKGAHPQVL